MCILWRRCSPIMARCMCRAIRKLVTNNKRRHSLILALHAAGDGNGYGNLVAVYKSVKSMHDSLAGGSGWTTEAGRCSHCMVQPSWTQCDSRPASVVPHHTMRLSE